MTLYATNLVKLFSSRKVHPVRQASFCRQRALLADQAALIPAGAFTSRAPFCWTEPCARDYNQTDPQADGTLNRAGFLIAVHEDQFLPPRLSGRCGFRKRSCAADDLSHVGFWVSLNQEF